MVRKLLLVGCVFAAAGVALYLVQTHYQGQTLVAQSVGPPGQLHTFTATRCDTVFLPGKPVPVRTEIKTIAVRADGSHAELGHRKDPSGSRKVLYIKKITDVLGRRRVVVEPLGESVTTYPLSEAAIGHFAVKSLTSCEGEPAGKLLGYEVVLNEATREFPGSDEKRKIRAWLASGLDCFPLRREKATLIDGQEVQLIVESVVALSEGEPEAWLFEIPPGYVERSPGEALAEAGRRYPNLKELGCSQCPQRGLDEAYSAHRRKP